MNEHAKWLREQAANDFTCERRLLAAANEVERLRDALLDIISLQPDPEFGAVPIKTAQDIAINALDMK